MNPGTISKAASIMAQAQLLIEANVPSGIKGKIDVLAGLMLSRADLQAELSAVSVKVEQ